MKSYDVIIIGAGHNGMAASIKLAKTGRKVLILESSSEFGGMASSNILLDDNQVTATGLYELAPNNININLNLSLIHI